MFLFDLHCDTITECYARKTGLVNDSMHLSIDRLLRSDRWVQMFAVFMPDHLRGKEAADYFDRVERFYHEELARHSDQIAQARDMCEVDALFAEKKIASILAVEGGSVLCGEMKRVERLKKAGVRLLTLTWNGENEIGSGSMTDKGLTGFGKELIPALEQSGIVVDVSHLNDAGFEDVVRTAKRPVIASHSNARSVCSHKRNLTDDQFRYIRSVGGLVGMNFYTLFIGDEDSSIDQLLRHIHHFLELGGEKILALGSDFDGADLPDYLNSVEKIAFLYDSMIKSGIDVQQAENILFGNAYRFFKNYDSAKFA